MPNDQIPAPIPFNPLDKVNLGESVAEAMLAGPVHHLPPEPFIGAGIYAIYYVGDYEPYSKIAERNRDGRYEQPIYVGKAVPAGARKGGLGLGVDPGKALFSRLSEHFESVSAARNISASDFFCRYLVVDDIWIPLAESLLIEKFQPVRNRVLDGFGNHNPGAGRYQQQRSPWDALHEGRDWADRLRPCAYTQEQLEARVKEYLESNIPNEAFTAEVHRT